MSNPVQVDIEFSGEHFVGEMVSLCLLCSLYVVFFPVQKVVFFMFVYNLLFSLPVSKMETESPAKSEERMKESVIVSGMNSDQITQIIR